MPHKKAPYWALIGYISLKLNKIHKRYLNLMSSQDRCSYCLPHMRKPIQEASSYCMPYRIRPLGVNVISLCLRNLQVLILFTSQDSFTQAVHLTGKVITLFRQSCMKDVHSTCASQIQRSSSCRDLTTGAGWGGHSVSPHNVCTTEEVL